jgi:hypothetical protein
MNAGTSLRAEARVVALLSPLASLLPVPPSLAGEGRMGAWDRLALIPTI